MTVRRAGFFVIPVLALLVAACGQAAPAGEPTTTASPETDLPPPTTTTVAPTTTELAVEVTEDPTVAVLDNVFEPAEIVVRAGTEVTWVWQGENEHNVASRWFESDLQVEGTFTHTFDEPGSYLYVCNPHRDMVGTVIVVP